MNRDDALDVLSLCTTLWPHSPMGRPDVVAKVWATALERFDTVEVVATLNEHMASGGRHAPLLGDVVRTLVERSDGAPEWDEAWAELSHHVREWGWRSDLRWEDGQRGAPPPAKACSHPVVARFAAEHWRELCHGPVPGADGYGTHYAQLRDAYAALRRRSVRDLALQALGSPRQPALTGHLRALPGGRAAA